MACIMSKVRTHATLILSCFSFEFCDLGCVYFRREIHYYMFDKPKWSMLRPPTCAQEKSDKTDVICIHTYSEGFESVLVCFLRLLLYPLAALLIR